MSLGTPLTLLPEQAATDGRVLLEGAGWTEIDGALVCPRCLTVEEEWELARSYIQMVETAVAREQLTGEDPRPHEAPMVAYAMVLRGRLTAAGATAPPPPGEGGSASATT